MHETSLNARVRSHLGNAQTAHTVHRSFPDWQTADIAIACLEFWAERGAEVTRFAGDPLLLCDPRNDTDAPIAPPVLQQVEVPGEPSCHGLREGLALIDLDGIPAIAACRWEHEPQRYEIVVVSVDLGAAQRLLDELTAFAEQRRPLTSSLLARVAASLNTRLRKHLGDDVVPSVLMHAFPEYQIANVAIQAKAFFDELGAEFTGAGNKQGGFTSFGREIDLTALLQAAEIDAFGRFDGFEHTPPAFEQFDAGGGPTRPGLREGLVLLHFEGEPLVVYCVRQDAGHSEYHVTVVARDTSVASRLLDAFLQFVRRHSIFRGRLIRPDIDYRDRVSNAEILPFAEVGWQDVVLPDAMRLSIERDILAYIRAADALAANGIDPKRGILLHGPPGTGKTFVCKLLAAELEGFTTILVTGANLSRPEGAFALARQLAPALLLFEDVDLVAKDREATGYPAALGGLLNELDGVPKGDRVYAVFTTNRLDVLEGALAQRPGRVDVIIGFPSPTPTLRRRLVTLYAGKAHVDAADIDWIVEHTDGVTPAFLREFMKEAVFTAIRTGAVDDHGIAVVERVHVTETLEHFEALRREHGADRILGFRG